MEGANPLRDLEDGLGRTKFTPHKPYRSKPMQFDESGTEYGRTLAVGLVGVDAFSGNGPSRAVGSCRLDN